MCVIIVCNDLIKWYSCELRSKIHVGVFVVKAYISVYMIFMPTFIISEFFSHESTMHFYNRSCPKFSLVNAIFYPKFMQSPSLWLEGIKVKINS